MLKVKNIDIFPVYHYKLEFTQEIRKQMQTKQYDRLLVELPFYLQDKVIEAIKELPAVSVVSCFQEEQEFLYLVEPSDPFIEAIRTALDQDIPIQFIDLAPKVSLSYIDNVPDSFCLYKLGYEKYFDLISPLIKRVKKTPHDKKREEQMVWDLQQVPETDKALFVTGIAHAWRISSLLKKKKGKPYDLLKFCKPENITFSFLAESCIGTILLEGAYISAAYEQSRKKNGKKKPRERSVEVEESRFKHLKVFTTKLDEGDKHFVGTLPLNKENVINRLLNRTISEYERENSEEIAGHKIKTYIKYCRNYARLNRAIIPSMYQLVIAARNCFDDDFAYLFWKNATSYPWKAPENKTNIRDINLFELGLDAQQITFHKKLFSKDRFFKKIKKRDEEVWGETLDPYSICSYQPEDIEIEDFGNNVKKKAQFKLNEEVSRVTPFLTSIHDGIDFRETIRNKPIDNKIYVREKRTIEDSFGSVVIIFDLDEEGAKYPYSMTWLGEHNQESDMAFYATEKESKQIGPGIFECQYGGFMLSFPPGRLFDVWSVRELNFFTKKYERLLAAGIVVSEDKNVVYLAPKKPSAAIKQFAKLYGVSITYIPLSQYSSQKLRRLKTFHVLSDKTKRDIADEYIFR